MGFHSATNRSPYRQDFGQPRFPNDFVERRQVEHVKAASGWQITGADLHVLDDTETEWLQRIMSKVMEARGEITRDPGMEDAALIDVTPRPPPPSQLVPLDEADIPDHPEQTPSNL